MTGPPFSAIRCSGSTPQTCDVTGTWRSQPGCAQPTPDCQTGGCACLETTCSGACTDTQTDGHLWSENYDREMKDIFEIQSEIAQPG